MAANATSEPAAREHPRYAPPRFFDTLFVRPHLAKALQAGAGKLNLLYAPPGCGKTSALTLHYQQLQHAPTARVYWLSLHALHNDLPCLLAHLCEALHQPQHTHWHMLSLPAQAHVFIDGLEQLSNPQAREHLLHLLLQLPAGTTAYSTDHPLHSTAQGLPCGQRLHQAHLQGAVQIIDISQLRLRNAEALQLLGPPWQPQHAALLNQRMQGWAAGLRLLQRTPHAAEKWLHDGLSQGMLPPSLSTYFDEVVCRFLPPATLVMLMALATLERFRSELLADMPQPRWDWSHIEPLLRGGWFMQAVPHAPEWVEVHPALAQHLRLRLQRQEPARYQALREFAAYWNAAQGHASEAVRHANQLRTPCATQLIEQAGAITVELTDGPDVMLGCPLPPERAAELPLVFLGQIYFRFRQGRMQEARHLFHTACQCTAHFTQLKFPALHDEVRGWYRLIHTLLLFAQDRDLSPTVLQMLQQEYQTQSSRNTVLAASLASLLAFQDLNAGHFTRAHEVCAQALQLQPRGSKAKALVFLHVHQASAALAQGTLEQAQRSIDAAQALAQYSCSAQSFEMHTLQLMQALLHFENGHTEQAEQLLRPALQHMHGVYGWTRLYANVFAMAMDLALRTAQPMAIDQVLQQGQRLALSRLLPRLQDLVQVLRLRSLIHTQAWEAALALVQSPHFVGLLRPTAASHFAHSTQVPAVLMAAQLHLTLQQTDAAQHTLDLLPSHWMDTADQRLLFHFHVLSMELAHHLHDSPNAAQHWQAAVQLAHRAGLRHRLQQAGAALHHVLGTLPAAQRAQLPLAWVQWWEQQYLPSQAPLANLPAPVPYGRRHTDTPLPCHSSCAPQPPGACPLSPRECDVLRLVAEGCMTKEIAERLGITEGTVKSHRKRIHQKLGVSRRSQAIQKAREWQLLP